MVAYEEGRSSLSTLHQNSGAREGLGGEEFLEIQIQHSCL